MKRPANSLGYSTFHLAFDIGWIDGRARILQRRVAEDVDLARFEVYFDIRDVQCKGVAGSIWLNRGFPNDFLAVVV